VLTFNLAFESNGAPRQIANEYIAERRAGDGSALVVITGMEQVLFTAYQQGAMFSDLGLPWASPSPSISAAGYIHYPPKLALKKKRERIEKNALSILCLSVSLSSVILSGQFAALGSSAGP
jgi:hypothetical protein